MLSRSPLAPITYRTLNDIVTDQLREAILSGQFPPGTTLNQRDIADQLSVSRMPVREAFRALELEGLIRGLPRRKAVVVTLQPEDVADIFDILATLEARAAEKAMPYHDESTIAQLRTLLEALRVCPDDDTTRLLDLDVELHLGIYQPPGSRIRLVIQTHRNAVRPHLIATGVAADRRHEAEAEHERIVAALEARDPAALARETAAHLRAEGRHLFEQLQTLRGAG
ncbi:MAG TPA: GntR family transcriptional regulator [Chloroflexota bacterium]|nr:GntR family transcriptional regulator [Chloroflexota bacterium]